MVTTTTRSVGARRVGVALLALLLLGALGACGERAATGSAGGGSEHAHDGEGMHSHDGEHAHAHDADEEGPPPVDVGPAVHHGPHDGVLARLSRADEPDFGFVELKLHDDKGDLELWLARDRDVTTPFDLPVDATITVTFADRDDRTVTLRVREKVANLDEGGTPNVRLGKTNYFIYPGESGADARWLRGTSFRSVVRVTLVQDGQAYVSDDFELRPHGQGDEHGHAHDGK